MTFGDALKRWRAERRLSQLDLGLSANVSARHISFLETGRARPSREMVLQLCVALDAPRRERNRMLTAAGLAPAYAARDLDDAEMAPMRDAVAWMLTRHAPYPAYALDRQWRILQMNAPAERLLGALGIGPGDSVVGALISNPALRAAIENFDEVATHSHARLMTEIAGFGGDVELEAMADRLAALIGSARPLDGLLPAMIPLRIRLGEAVFSFFSTLAQFGGTEDIALAEMKIELMFPADETTRLALTAGA